MLHFLGIGAQKAGTTWLYTQLSRHPQVRFPAGKEVHFWDRDAARDLAWYRSQFEGSDGDEIRNGEITPAYGILSPKRVEEIYAHFPDLRLLYLVRNPIERAWSSALMAVNRAEMDPDEASDQWFVDHFQSRGSLRRGDYEACIRTWEGVYPKEQLLILRYEAIQDGPRRLMERVAAHLGIDTGFYAALPDDALKRRVFAGSGHPLRSSLQTLLERLYGEKVRSLGRYLRADLNWLGETPSGLGETQDAPETVRARLSSTEARSPAAAVGHDRPARSKPTAASPTAILVLGMHRSGTSALTRVINLLGADLPSNLMPAVENNNEAGFWESMDAYRLNDDILVSAGSSWDDWRRFNPDWMRSPAKDAFKTRALALLEQDFSGSPLFVFKDPRICRLLPFWLEVLDVFGANVKCVLPIRNVLEVAASLQARDGFSRPKSYMLWLRHLLDAEMGTRGLARAFIDYDGLLDDWRNEVRKLADRLRIVWPRRSATAEVKIDRFLQPGYRHHSIDGLDVLENPDLPAWVKETYKAFEELEKDPDSEAARRRISGVGKELDRASDALGAVVRSEELAREESRRARDLAEKKLQDAVSTGDARLNDLEQALVAREGRIRELDNAVSDRETRIEDLRRDLKNRRHEWETARDQRNRLLYRMNAIQTSATWQLSRPWRFAEGRHPGLVRGVAATPKLVWWASTFRLPGRLRLRRQANDLLATGLFDLPWYLARNSDVVLNGLNPVLHWLVAGWREGRDPNPLFAVDWYLAQNPEVASEGVNPLLHYRQQGWRDGCEPYPMFDSSWYMRQYPEVREAGVNPLTHFLTQGAAEGNEPSPLLQTPIYLDSQSPACTPVEALRHFAESGKAFAPGAYRTFEVLSSLQREYRAKTSMRLLRDRRTDGKRFALYLQCGAGSIHARWLSDATKPWDLIVNHYDPAFVGKLPCEVEFQQVGELPGTKFTSFHTLLNRWPKLADAYDYLLLLDDDIYIEESDVAALFDVAAEQALDLAQPSLSAESHGCHDVFRTCGSNGLRYVNGVEIMMPVISRQALQVGAHLFGETISGWGLDVALAKLVRQRLNGDAAIVDRIVVEHTKPIDLDGGAFYRMLRQANIYPLLEYGHLTKTYDTDRTFFEL